MIKAIKEEQIPEIIKSFPTNGLFSFSFYLEDMKLRGALAAKQGASISGGHLKFYGGISGQSFRVPIRAIASISRKGDVYIVDRTPVYHRQMTDEERSAFFNKHLNEVKRFMNVDTLDELVDILTHGGRIKQQGHCVFDNEWNKERSCKDCGDPSACPRFMEIFQNVVDEIVLEQIERGDEDK